jgi:hypothetical protein
MINHKYRNCCLMTTLPSLQARHGYCPATPGGIKVCRFEWVLAFVQLSLAAIDLLVSSAFQFYGKVLACKTGRARKCATQLET